MQLADLYDADRRVRDPEVRTVSGKYRIPHPLSSVQYADGKSSATAGREVRSPWIQEKES